MTNPTHLLITLDPSPDLEVVVINFDTKEQIGINTAEAYSFFPDCIGLNDDLAERYSNGQPVAVGMTAEDWALWLAGFELVESADFVWLTLCQEGEFDNCIGALCLTDSREAIAPPDEKTALVADLIGFDAASFNQGAGVVARMTAANWAAWLEHFEVAALPAESAALLTA